MTPGVPSLACRRNSLRPSPSDVRIRTSRSSGGKYYDDQVLTREIDVYC